MGAFKKFIEGWKTQENQKLLTDGEESLAIEGIRSEILPVPKLDNLEKDKFATEMVQFATSPEFIDILDSKLAPPLPGETKEMFVERALGIVRKIMLEKID